MNKVTAVILDIDGTLLDSNDAHARAFVAAAEELGLASPGFEKVRGMIGMGGDKLIPEAFGIDSESKDGKRLDGRKGEIFRETLSELRPTPGARALLERFRQRGLGRVVATSANEEDVRLLLDQAGVADLVEAFTSASDVENSKPDPDIVRAALALVAKPAEQVVMIGDTPYDVEAAIRAGVRIVAVRSGGWGDRDLQGALSIYDDPSDLLVQYEQSIFT